MALSSLGIGSGLNLSGMVTDLMKLERQPRAQLDVKEATFQAKLSAIGTIKGGLASLQSAARSLGSYTQFLQTTASVTDGNSLAASTTSVAQTGTHTYEVFQLAQAQRLKSDAYSSVDKTIGTGKITIQFGEINGTVNNDGQYDPGATFTPNGDKGSVTIDIDSSKNTLTGVRDAINAAKAGVTASIVNDGNGFRLVLASDSTGAKNAMRISVDDADGNSNDGGANAGLSQLAFDPTLLAGSGQNISQAAVAKSASVKIDGISITSQTNTLTDAISGVTLTLKATTTATQSLTIGRDSSGAAKQIEGFVKAYNELNKQLGDLSSYDPQSKKAAVLQGETVVRSVQFQLKSIMNGVLPGGSFTRLADAGISFDKSGTMTFDSAKFAANASSNAEGMASLFAAYGTTNDAQVRYISAGSATRPGSYSVDVERLASQATYIGRTASSLTIDDDNDTFSIKVDGVSSGSIKLTHATYASEADLAVELQSRINGDASLKSAGASVSVAYDAAQGAYVIKSNRYASSSKIELGAVDTNSEATLGLATGTRFGYAGTTINSLVIDDSNDNFSVTVDGVSSGTINLTHGTYNSKADLATEIQTQINANLGGSASVRVRFDEAANRFDIMSEKLDASAGFSIDSADSGMGLTLGIATAAGRNTGYDVEGTIGGRTATGVGQFLTGQGDALDLKIQITGGSASPSGLSRGAVSYNQGFAYQLDKAIEQMVSATGTLSSRINGINRAVQDIGKQRVAFDARLETVEKRYRDQFTALDTLVARMQQTSSYLSQQLANLPKVG
ncbi:flagellar filament capping protein FliD [Chitinimonas lacunae]|uniref:Flagellar hook-associated protein 2 n=1 Tax=Chitinimonas lacunae TaxID=1963018 RepID=A0ABV8MXY6_9NEIS